jgi:hypothetical protein
MSFFMVHLPHRVLCDPMSSFTHLEDLPSL